MLNKKKYLDNTGTALVDTPNRADDGLEEELDSYTRSAVSRIRFDTLVKSAVISFIALIISFFITWERGGSRIPRLLSLG